VGQLSLFNSHFSTLTLQLSLFNSLSNFNSLSSTSLSSNQNNLTDQGNGSGTEAQNVASRYLNDSTNVGLYNVVMVRDGVYFSGQIPILNLKQLPAPP